MRNDVNNVNIYPLMNDQPLYRLVLDYSTPNLYETLEGRMAFVGGSAESMFVVEGEITEQNTWRFDWLNSGGDFDFTGIAAVGVFESASAEDPLFTAVNSAAPEEFDE